MEFIEKEIVYRWRGSGWYEWEEKENFIQFEFLSGNKAEELERSARLMWCDSESDLRKIQDDTWTENPYILVI